MFTSIASFESHSSHMELRGRQVGFIAHILQMRTGLKDGGCCPTSCQEAIEVWIPKASQLPCLSPFHLETLPFSLARILVLVALINNSHLFWVWVVLKHKGV